MSHWGKQRTVIQIFNDLGETQVGHVIIWGCPKCMVHWQIHPNQSQLGYLPVYTFPCLSSIDDLRLSFSKAVGEPNVHLSVRSSNLPPFIPSMVPTEPNQHIYNSTTDCSPSPHLMSCSTCCTIEATPSCTS